MPAVRLPRFRLRTLLIAVAGVAVLIGVDDMRRRRDRSLAIRARHAAEEKHCQHMVQAHSEVAAQNEAEAKRLREAVRAGADERIAQFAVVIESAAASGRAKAQRQLTLARFHGELRRKYDRAARRPWLPVPPDPHPPPPE
jgi:hypothetical protein